VSRVILILLAIPLVLVIAAAVLIPLLLDEEKILNMAAETLEKETGAILAVDGGASLSIFPRIEVQLAEAGITMPGEQEMSVRARSLGIGLELMPLFSGSVEIDEISVDGLVVTMQSAPEEPSLDTSTLTDEQLDAYYEKRRRDNESAGQAAGQESVAALPLALNVQRLSVTDSVLEIVSADTDERTRVTIINLEGLDLNLDERAMPLSMKIRLEGEEPIVVDIKGEVKANADDQQLIIDALAVDVNGALAQPVSLETSGAIDLGKQIADLQLKLVLGDMQGDGKLRYASFETPQIDANLHLNKFDPALLALAGPDAATAADNDSSTGGASTDGDQPLPLNAIRAIDTRARLLIDQADFSGHVVNKMRVNLRVVDGIARVTALKGNLHGGALDVKATFNGQHNIAKLNTAGGLTGMDIAQALKAMDSEPIMTGKVDIQWRLNSNGSTSNQLVEAMRGPIDLLTSEVTLQELGVEKMLCGAVALVNRESLSKPLPESTRFENLSVKLKMGKGKLHMKPFRAELANVKLNGEGAMDILKQDFSATFIARLSAGLGELDPACRVNERLTAIDWPVNCKGSLADDPARWCSVDSQEIIEQMAKKEVQHQVEKEAGKLFNKLFKK